jgi:hypothetical protein
MTQDKAKPEEPKVKREDVFFPELTIQTNFGLYHLKDANWQEYTERPGEGVGNVSGFVVSGGDTSRILQYTSFTDHAGTTKIFHSVVLDRLHKSYKDFKGNMTVPHFEMTFC